MIKTLLPTRKRNVAAILFSFQVTVDELLALKDTKAKERDDLRSEAFAMALDAAEADREAARAQLVADKIAALIAA